MNKVVGIVLTALGLLIVAIMWTTTTWDVPIVETYYTYEPYTYEQTFVRTNQVHTGFLWLNEVTQAQYLVKNTDTQTGTFLLNFVFDNGTNTNTKTGNIDIQASEQKAVSMNSPLKGVSKVSLKVVPPNKVIAHQRQGTKKVNGWDYLGRMIFNLK